MKSILWHRGRSEDTQYKGQRNIIDRSCSSRGCDALTGVAGRKNFQKTVETALQEEGVQGCLLILDVDRMQDINERYGQNMGDRVLQNVAVMLRENFRNCDSLGRLEEDEFAIWIRGLSPEHVDGIRRRVAHLNDKLMHMGEEVPMVTLSAGVAFGEAGDEFKSIYERAREVLYRVKERGRCGCEVYERHRP